jgi:hypothetical protein
MATFQEALEYIKQDIKDGFTLSYYIEDGKIYAETDQGFIRWFPVLNSEEIL